MKKTRLRRKKISSTSSRKKSSSKQDKKAGKEGTGKRIWGKTSEKKHKVGNDWKKRTGE